MLGLCSSGSNFSRVGMGRRRCVWGGGGGGGRRRCVCGGGVWGGEDVCGVGGGGKYLITCYFTQARIIGHYLS